MADMFSNEDTRSLLREKYILMLGDSNTRATYKDLVLLLNRNEILDLRRLFHDKGEESFEGDTRVRFSGLIKGRGYREGREFVKHDVRVEYEFITRCYSDEIELIFRKIKNGEKKTPDIVVMNSCIWDISRWGPNGVEPYKENMKRLMLLLDKCLPRSTLFIWTTALPVSTVVKGGLMIKQIDFLQSMLRFEVMEANLFCRSLVVSHGYGFLDTHYYLRMQIHRRRKDGLHYEPLPVRYITNLLLTHIALSWNVSLPGNSKGVALERLIETVECRTSTPAEAVLLPHIPNSLALNNDNEGVELKKPRWNSKRKMNFGRANFRNSTSRSNHRRMPNTSVWENDTWSSKAQQQPQQQQQQPPSQQQQIPAYSPWNDDDRRNYPYVNQYVANGGSGGGLGPIRRNFSKYRGKRHGSY